MNLGYEFYCAEDIPKCFVIELISYSLKYQSFSCMGQSPWGYKYTFGTPSQKCHIIEFIIGAQSFSSLRTSHIHVHHQSLFEVELLSIACLLCVQVSECTSLHVIHSYQYVFNSRSLILVIFLGGSLPNQPQTPTLVRPGGALPNQPQTKPTIGNQWTKALLTWARRKSLCLKLLVTIVMPRVCARSWHHTQLCSRIYKLSGYRRG
jgi:hypothetical protein